MRKYHISTEIHRFITKFNKAYVDTSLSDLAPMFTYKLRYMHYDPDMIKLLAFHLLNNSEKKNAQKQTELGN